MAFVRVIALIERVGNALGTLAFTWATVVLLGGYPTALHGDDFCFATAIVFLEASRMFSRNNRLDYQLFFDTRGAFKPLGWNGLTVVVIFTSVTVFLTNYGFWSNLPHKVLGMPVGVAALVALAVAQFLSPGLSRLLGYNLLRRAISLWSPRVPILFLGLSIRYTSTSTEHGTGVTAKLVAFLILLVVVLLLTISRLRFPSIITVVDRAMGSKQVFWHRVVLNSCMFSTGVLLAFMLPFTESWKIITYEVFYVLIVSLGNLQIPAAILRVVLAQLRLMPYDYYGDKNDSNKINLVPSLNIFYGMVLGQGILYCLACILELFSVIPRRSLARRGGFGGQWGAESINLYYAYAFEKYIQGDILAPKNISLNNFAVDSLNSDTPHLLLLSSEEMGGLRGSEIAKLILFVLLLMAVLLLTISRLRFPSIIKLVDRALGSKRVLWHRVILNLCILAASLMLAFWFEDGISILSLILGELCVAAIVSSGNLQIPAATVRVVLALLRLVPRDYYGGNVKEIDTSKPENEGKINLAPSLNIFYGMVLGQGILYGVACILELFSFFPRRSLARRGGFGGRWGVESVNLYYAYAFEKYMQGDILAPKNINLNNFAVDSLNSDTHTMQFHGIRIMHNLLQKQPTRRQFIFKLNPSMQTMSRLISMLDWTSPEDTTVRLFAAKVTAELATSIRVVTVPGIVQVVSALLDYGNQQKRGCPLLETNVGHEKIHDSILNVNENQGDTGSLLETQDHSTEQVGTDEQKSWIFKCWKQISKFWSISQEEPLTEQDILPALDMLILDGLASCDQGNCVEISRASGLIPKIIAFTSCRRSGTTYTDAQRKVLVKSSLKLVHRLTGVEGEIGVTLRHKLSKSPFLLRNLAEILEDGRSSQELRTLVIGNLRNLAIDENARQKIGRIQVIITWLKQTFLRTDSSTDADRLLREVAGQALAMLAMDNGNNCLAMLGETCHEFIMVLTSMVHIDRYRCVAASLLRNICQHARPELKEQDLKELSYCLRQALEIVLVAGGAQLEIFLGLSSQICQVIPQDFTKELENGHKKDRFVKRLIDALNSYMESSPHCPGIRRVILEQTINMMEMEHDSCYTTCFINHRMVEALSMVEETTSEAENYSLFLGDVGLMEARNPLSSLVERAKQLLAVR